VKFTGPTRPATDSDLLEGSIVVHPTFGPGEIAASSGTGDKLKLSIRFNAAGTKSLIVKFAKLEVPE
jgi:DNA helicase-2/ATP-dependent DNA helicase PcrA